MRWCISGKSRPNVCIICHGVWKSQKKSHSTLRAKRATFSIWVDKSSSKMPKMVVNFNEFLKTWSLQSNSVTRQINFNKTKIRGKWQNSKIQMRHLCWFSNFVCVWNSFEKGSKGLFKFYIKRYQGSPLETLEVWRVCWNRSIDFSQSHKVWKQKKAQR